jgi:phosphoribosyl-AMP cyclohydrolase
MSKMYINGKAIKQQVRIGKFSIWQLDEKDVWIQDEESGEGSQFSGQKIEKDLQKLFDKWF